MIKARIWLVVGLLSISQGLMGFGPKTVVSPRSQALFLPREHAGWDHLIYDHDRESNSATVGVAPSYQRSFRNDKIINMLFGCPELVFSGSQVADRDATDILADY